MTLVVLTLYFKLIYLLWGPIVKWLRRNIFTVKCTGSIPVWAYLIIYRLKGI